MDKISFIKKIEKLTNPKDIALLQTISPLSKFIPKKIQNKLFLKSSSKTPYMGFVVEPYSTFICYKIKDLDYAKQLLPDGFELVKSSLFKDSLPEYWAIVGCFNVHSSAFWGTRLEFNLIARNKKNNLTSWVIVDYETNALSHDKYNGLQSSTTDHAIVTTDFDGNIIIDIKNADKKRELSTVFSTCEATKETLGEKIWLDGNWSVGYGKKLSRNSDETFSLKFDPKETEAAYRVPSDLINVKNIGWFTPLIEDAPSETIYFPYTQHYLSDSPGSYSKIASKNDMIQQMANLNEIPPYSVSPIRKMFVAMFFFNSFLMLLFLFLLLFN